MNLTLADLISNAVEARAHEETVVNSWTAGDFTIHSAKENSQLALNALTERLEEMIEHKITQMLKELRP